MVIEKEEITWITKTAYGFDECPRIKVLMNIKRVGTSNSKWN